MWLRRRSDLVVDASQNTHRLRRPWWLRSCLGCGFGVRVLFNESTAQHGARIGGEIATFGIGGVAVKNKSAQIVVLKSDHAAGGSAGGVGVGEGMAAGSAGSCLYAWASQV